MNKKLFSAAIFGALLLGTASTFVSCKDYDDDIQNLQTQITANKDAIAQLQALVGSGNWVSSINSIEGGFVVNMSNGQSVTVTGINGKDGKNGTEWIIGEDGMWYKDGAQTEFKAVATDGKDGEAGIAGVTAPSPTIDANGMWVVYEFDEETGKFVAKTTEISAQGTSAYAVTKDGVVTLHIADETGKYQEIALPATADSFVAAAPAPKTTVVLEEAKWNTYSGKEHKARLEKLTKAFPEIANYKKGDLMKQGGNLPVIITPANVELNDNFKFSLQNVKGEFSGAILSQPVKGMPEVTSNEGWSMVTRATDANDGFWSISVELEKNQKGDAYVNITEPHSLVIENEKGTVAKTPFSYLVRATNISDVTVQAYGTADYSYADEIDVFADDEVYGPLFTKKNDMNGHYIVEVDEPADVVQYGITVENNKIKIAKFPENKSWVYIRNVKVTVLGLNGSTAEAVRDIGVSKKMEVSDTLSPQEITLNAKVNSSNEYWNTVTWDVAELGMDAAQLENFIDNIKYNNVRVSLKYVNENGDEVYASLNDNNLYAFDKDGKVTTDYKAAKTVGFKFESNELIPMEYDVTVQAYGLYTAATTLTVKNPTATVISLYPELVNNGVLQIVGKPSATNVVTYDMSTGIKKADIVTIDKFIDLDADEDDAATSWILSDNNTLQVYKNGVEVSGEEMHQLYTTRHFKVTYSLFGNADNTEEFEFEGQVISELYSEDVTKAITIAKDLSAIFGGEKKTNQINLIEATKAVAIAGPNAGKEYSLFTITKNTPATTTYDYSAPKTIMSSNNVEYLLKGTKIVTVTNPAYLVALGRDIDGSNTNFTKSAWDRVWGVASKYYNTDGTLVDKNQKVKDEDAIMVALFEEYMSLIDFNGTEGKPGEKVDPMDIRVESATFAPVDQDTFNKFASLENGVVTAKNPSEVPANDIKDGKVTLKMNLNVKDKWGMEMVVPFEITLKTSSK